MHARSLDAVVAKGLCVGCGACASGTSGNGDANLPRMQLLASGFLRPIPVAGGIESAEFEKLCPAIYLRHENHKVPVHLEWGPLTSVRTGWASDTEVRFRGSSGGSISALLIHLLETWQVDFVAHIAVSQDDPLRNERQFSRSRSDVLRGAGSRYAPAAPLQDIDQLFSSGERFAFVGKPCDVAALRNHLNLRPERRSQVKAVLSFMCAGVPSINGTHEVLSALGTCASDVIEFRYRGNGWPGVARAVVRDGQTLEMDYNRSWGQILGHQLQLRCKLCPDGTGEFADVVCADAWYGKDGYPDFTEREGRSLILGRTVLGENLISSAVTAGALVVEPCEVERIAEMQPYQWSRKQVVMGRWFGFWLRRRIWPSFHGLRLLATSIRGGLMPVMRNAWGTYRRLNKPGDTTWF